MFECEGDGLPAPNVTWYKDNSLLRDFKPNILVYPDGVLEINPVEFSDFGTYYCQVENTERARSSRLAKLAQNGNTGQGSSKLIWLSWSQGMQENRCVFFYSGSKVTHISRALLSEFSSYAHKLQSLKVTANLKAKCFNS